MEDQVARGSERQNNDFDEVNRSLPRARGDSFLPPFIRPKGRKKTSGIDSDITSDIGSAYFCWYVAKIGNTHFQENWQFLSMR